jgi:hypothetical protein
LYESFSDLTLRTIQVSSPDFLLIHPEMLIYELESVAKIQYNLIAREDVVISGGVAVGDLVKSWGLVFGSAMVKAHIQGEKAEQAYVLLDPFVVGIIEKIKEDDDGDNWSSSFNRIVSRDGELYFVDYLQYSLIHFSNEGDLLDFLYKHKSFVETKLTEYEQHGRIRDKYLWLKAYHNSRIPDVAPPYEREELLIP